LLHRLGLTRSAAVLALRVNLSKCGDIKCLSLLFCVANSCPANDDLSLETIFGCSLLRAALRPKEQRAPAAAALALAVAALAQG